MAAVIEPTGASATAGQQQTKRIRFGSVEPALLVVLKQLDPLVAVLCLIACVLVCRGPFTPGLGAVAVLTFVIASRVFGRASRDEEMAGARITTTFPRIVLEWFLVVCILLLVGFAFKVTAQFSRAMMLTWFAITPFALYAAHAMRLRARWLIANSDYGPSYLIIGANSVGFELLRRLPSKGFLGFFDFRSADRLPDTIDPAHLIGHCKDVAEFARSHGVGQIVLGRSRDHWWRQITGRTAVARMLNEGSEFDVYVTARNGNGVLWTYEMPGGAQEIIEFPTKPAIAPPRRRTVAKLKDSAKTKKNTGGGDAS